MHYSRASCQYRLGLKAMLAVRRKSTSKNSIPADIAQALRSAVIAFCQASSIWSSVLRLLPIAVSELPKERLG